MSKKIIYLKEDTGQTHSDMPSDASNPCLNCGACCEHFRISFYFAETTDHEHGTVPAELTEKMDDFRVCMKGSWSKTPRCTALTGQVGQNIGCSIYENRPSVCRAYHVWDPETGQPNEKCQELRAKIGLPLLSPMPL